MANPGSGDKCGYATAAMRVPRRSVIAAVAGRYFVLPAVVFLHSERNFLRSLP
jgi:hypothetical protein